MTFVKRISVIAVALVLGLGSLELGANIGVPGFHSAVGEAIARVGRPATPVSVAGAGRRTVRRCAAGVYVC